MSKQIEHVQVSRHCNSEERLKLRSHQSSSIGQVAESFGQQSGSNSNHSKPNRFPMVGLPGHGQAKLKDSHAHSIPGGHLSTHDKAERNDCSQQNENKLLQVEIEAVWSALQSNTESDQRRRNNRISYRYHSLDEPWTHSPRKHVEIDKRKSRRFAGCLGQSKNHNCQTPTTRPNRFEVRGHTGNKNEE